MATAWVVDGDLLNTRGQLAKGHLQIERMLEEEHRTSMRDTTARMKVVRVRALTSAWVHADASMELEGVRLLGGGVAPPMRMQVSLVAREEIGLWRYVMVRPSVVASGF